MASKRRARNRELEAGTSAHYEDPAYYAKAYRDRADDVRYYVDATTKSGGPVLELGCGNGRIALPIAHSGVEIVGVDLSAEMIADFRERLKTEPPEVRKRVRARQGDMCSVNLKRKFPLVICPFNAFLHLYTRRDVERFLATVHRHLAPRGELVFDVSMPDPEELARDPNRAYHTPRFSYPGVGVVKYRERFDYDRLQQVLFVSMEFAPRDATEAWMTPLAHRQFYPQELDALLHYNGFKVQKLRGDFTQDDATNESWTLVYHCRRA